MVYGLITGMVFAYILKRSRFCFTGTIRDIYVEKNYYNVALIMAAIFTHSAVYYGMVYFKVFSRPFFDPFSLVAIAVGSLMFGFGAVLSNGCATAGLLKAGDGRIVGIASVITFAFGAYLANMGVLKTIFDGMSKMAVVKDMLIKSLPANPFFISLAAALILYAVLIRHYMKHKPKFKFPSKHKGLRHIFFEKVWGKEITVVLLGIVMASAFYTSMRVGRVGGAAISSPILSWFAHITGLKVVAGGWSVVEETDGIGWANMFVLGIVLGSFITAFLSEEFTIVKVNLKNFIKSIIGSFMMGVGAMWASGCIIGNGIVGTAQLSLKAWYALAFLALGIWIASYIFHVRVLKKFK